MSSSPLVIRHPAHSPERPLEPDPFPQSPSSRSPPYHHAPPLPMMCCPPATQGTSGGSSSRQAAGFSPRGSIGSTADSDDDEALSHVSASLRPSPTRSFTSLPSLTLASTASSSGLTTQAPTPRPTAPVEIGTSGSGRITRVKSFPHTADLVGFSPSDEAGPSTASSSRLRRPSTITMMVDDEQDDRMDVDEPADTETVVPQSGRLETETTSSSRTIRAGSAPASPTDQVTFTPTSRWSRRARPVSIPTAPTASQLSPAQPVLSPQRAQLVPLASTSGDANAAAAAAGPATRTASDSGTTDPQLEAERFTSFADNIWNDLGPTYNVRNDARPSPFSIRPVAVDASRSHSDDVTSTRANHFSAFSTAPAQGSTSRLAGLTDFADHSLQRSRSIGRLIAERRAAIRAAARERTDENGLGSGRIGGLNRGDRDPVFTLPHNEPTVPPPRNSPPTPHMFSFDLPAWAQNTGAEGSGNSSRQPLPDAASRSGYRVGSTSGFPQHAAASRHREHEGETDRDGVARSEPMRYPQPGERTVLSSSHGSTGNGVHEMAEAAAVRAAQRARILTERIARLDALRTATATATTSSNVSPTSDESGAANSSRRRRPVSPIPNLGSDAAGSSSVTPRPRSPGTILAELWQTPTRPTPAPLLRASSQQERAESAEPYRVPTPPSLTRQRAREHVGGPSQGAQDAERRMWGSATMLGHVPRTSDASSAIANSSAATSNPAIAAPSSSSSTEARPQGAPDDSFGFGSVTSSAGYREWFARRHGQDFNQLAERERNREAAEEDERERQRERQRAARLAARATVDVPLAPDQIDELSSADDPMFRIAQGARRIASEQREQRRAVAERRGDWGSGPAQLTMPPDGIEQSDGGLFRRVQDLAQAQSHRPDPSSPLSNAPRSEAEQAEAEFRRNYLRGVATGQRPSWSSGRNAETRAVLDQMEQYRDRLAAAESDRVQSESARNRGEQSRNQGESTASGSRWDARNGQQTYPSDLFGFSDWLEAQRRQRRRWLPDDMEPSRIGPEGEPTMMDIYRRPRSVASGSASIRAQWGEVDDLGSSSTDPDTDPAGPRGFSPALLARLEEQNRHRAQALRSVGEQSRPESNGMVFGRGNDEVTMYGTHGYNLLTGLPTHLEAEFGPSSPPDREAQLRHPDAVAQAELEGAGWGSRLIPIDTTNTATTGPRDAIEQMDNQSRVTTFDSEWRRPRVFNPREIDGSSSQGIPGSTAELAASWYVPDTIGSTRAPLVSDSSSEDATSQDEWWPPSSSSTREANITAAAHAEAEERRRREVRTPPFHWRYMTDFAASAGDTRYAAPPAPLAPGQIAPTRTHERTERDRERPSWRRYPYPGETPSSSTPAPSSIEFGDMVRTARARIEENRALRAMRTTGTGTTGEATVPPPRDPWQPPPAGFWTHGLGGGNDYDRASYGHPYFNNGALAGHTAGFGGLTLPPPGSHLAHPPHLPQGPHGSRALSAAALAYSAGLPMCFVDGMSRAEQLAVLENIKKFVVRMPPPTKQSLVHKVLEKSEWEGVDEVVKDAACPICQDDYEADAKVTTTPCKHMFHTGCLEAWLTSLSAPTTCPMCRRDMAVIAFIRKAKGAICSPAADMTHLWLGVELNPANPVVDAVDAAAAVAPVPEVPASGVVSTNSRSTGTEASQPVSEHTATPQPDIAAGPSTTLSDPSIV